MSPMEDTEEDRDDVFFSTRTGLEEAGGGGGGGGEVE